MDNVERLRELRVSEKLVESVGKIMSDVCMGLLILEVYCSFSAPTYNSYSGVYRRRAECKVHADFKLKVNAIGDLPSS